GVGLALGGEVDRRAVQSRRDGAGEEGTVVVGVVPGEAALVEGVLPERRHELHRLDRLLRVEDDRLAVLLDLAAAPRPEEGIGEGRGVAEGVAERLAERPALRLQLLAGLAVLLPGLRKLLEAGLGEPGFAPRDLGADDAPGHRHPLLPVMRDRLRFGIEAL